MSMIQEPQPFEQPNLTSHQRSNPESTNLEPDDGSLNDSPTNHQFDDQFGIILELKDAEIATLKKENESLKLMNEIHDNIKEENLILGTELQKKIDEVLFLRERIEAPQQDVHTFGHNIAEDSHNEKKSHRNSENLSLSTAASSQRKASELSHESSNHLQEFLQEFNRQTDHHHNSQLGANEDTHERRRRMSHEILKKDVEDQAAALNQLNDRIWQMKVDQDRNNEALKEYLEERIKEVIRSELERRTVHQPSAKSLGKSSQEERRAKAEQLLRVIDGNPKLGAIIESQQKEAGNLGMKRSHVNKHSKRNSASFHRRNAVVELFN